MTFSKMTSWVNECYETIKEVWRGDDEGATTKPQMLHLEDHQYPTFTKLLPYQYYNESEKIFFNEHNAGLIYRIIPLTGGNEQIAEQLDTLLRTKISHDLTLQVLLVKHNQVGHQIDAFSKQFSKSDFQNLESMGDNLKRFYQNAAVNGFHTNTNIKPRLTHTECFIVVDKVKKGTEADINAFFGQFRISFEAALMASKIGFHRADVIDFLKLMAFYFNHDTKNLYPKEVQYDKTLPLKSQVLSHAFDIDVKNDGLLIHGMNDKGGSYETAISVLTLDRLPDTFHLWENLNNTNNIFSPEQSIPCNHIISVTYLVDEQAKAESRANRKTRDLDKKSKTDYALHVAGTEKQAREWRTFREDLTSQKTQSVKMLYNVILFSNPLNKARDREAAINVFKYNRIHMTLCRRFQLPYFLTSIPFFFTGNLSKDFSLPTLMWPISSWNATQYMPLLSDWAGVGKGILLPTTRDQFACIDPFLGTFGTNYNMAVTGISGGGKSFFIQMMLLNVLFNGGDVFIIDVGGSYRKLCEMLGGTYLEYKHLAMNPFTYVTDINLEIDDIVALFELLSCPTEGASDDDRGTLREAILNAFSKTATNTYVDDIQAALLGLYEEDRTTYPTAKILAKNLKPYSKNAEHGKAFNEPSKLSPSARFIVVDLKEIEDIQNIREPVLLSVLSQYQRRMFNSDRSRRKMCIIDEAWAFFTGDPTAVKFVNRGFRTGRRYNVSFTTITQGIEDYYKFHEARAAWENSALKLIFLQDNDALLAHQKDHETFSDYELKLLKSFPKAKDAGFSEVLLRANGMSSFHRLFVDDFTRVLLSSDGKDYQEVMDYVDQGLSYSEAILRVSQGKEVPYEA